MGKVDVTKEMTQLTAITAHLEKTWLAWGKPGAGCICCNFAGLRGNLALLDVSTASALQISNLKKHHNSRAHGEAAKAFVAKDLSEALSAGALLRANSTRCSQT